MSGDFFWRRVQSLAGLGLVVFLFFHLWTNASASPWWGGENVYAAAVNRIHAMPFLGWIEVGLLALPLLIHTLWGIVYLYSSSYNAFPTDGSAPALPEYPRNRAYTWQRLTAVLLIFGIAAHVAHMRWMEAPQAVSNEFEIQTAAGAVRASSFGSAVWKMVQENFRSLPIQVLYTLFVWTAVYHAFNGLWTFLITWGVTLSAHAQNVSRIVTRLLMIGLGFLGFLAIWGW